MGAERIAPPAAAISRTDDRAGDDRSGGREAVGLGTAR
jgi:hypothetical protein